MHLCPKIFSTFSYLCNCCRGNKGSSRIKPETTHSMIKMAAPCVNSPRSQTLLNSLIVKSCSHKICGHTWFPLYTLYPQAKIGNFRKTPPEQNLPDSDSESQSRPTVFTYYFLSLLYCYQLTASFVWWYNAIAEQVNLVKQGVIVWHISCDEYIISFFGEYIFSLHCVGFN